MGQIYAGSWRLGVALFAIGLALTVCFRTLQTRPLTSAVCPAYLLLIVVMLALGRGRSSMRYAAYETIEV